MKVQPIRMRWGRGNNYAYIVIDEKSKEATIIDPAEPAEVQAPLEALKKEHIKLTSIMNTHHHYDHAGGNEELHHLYSDLPVVAGKDSPLVTKTPADGETHKLGDNVLITAIHTPCHTQDSITWYFKDLNTDEKAVFTGDTLFIAGCGRFFEGTAKEMKKSLEKITALPDDTIIYPGHEYTKDNVRFVKTVLKNDAVHSLENFVNTYEESTGKFTIADEKKYNPFVRLTDPQILKATNKTDPVDVMAQLRELKNNM